MKKGQIVIIPDFKLNALNRKRTLRIYLPPTYDGTKRFPVLYMHDGQNLYDDATAGYGVSWKIADTLDALVHDKKMDGIIVVGIDNEGFYRLEEYYPWTVTHIHALFNMDQSIPTGGKGFLYLASLVESVKPYIDQHYKTLSEAANTAISGSSMGGIISLVAGVIYPNVFSKVAAFSSAFYFGGQPFMDWLEHQPIYPSKVYMDIGTKETSSDLNSDFPSIYTKTNRQVFDILKAHLNPSKLRFVVDEGAIHHESAWAKRFKDMILWLYGN